MLKIEFFVSKKVFRIKNGIFFPNGVAFGVDVVKIRRSHVFSEV